MQKLSTDECVARFALLSIKGIGPSMLENMIHQFGSALNAFTASPKSLMNISGMRNEMVKNIRNFKNRSLWEKEVSLNQKENIFTYFWDEPQYPHRLKHISQPPAFVMCKGKIDLNVKRILGIVGTRQPSIQGKQWLIDVMHHLGDKNILIVSGLAKGIDAIAHQEALSQGFSTLGVLGHSLDRIYPYENKSLAMKMLNQGGWLSTYHRGTLPDRNHFPERNQIVAGISDGIIVVESGLTGGSMITARLAFEQDREVMAVPGFPGKKEAEGCNNLIKKMKAALIENASDILEIMNWDIQSESRIPVSTKQLQLLPPADPEQAVIFSLLQNGPLDADSLISKTGKPAFLINRILVEMELDGFIQAMPGKRFGILS